MLLVTRAVLARGLALEELDDGGLSLRLPGGESAQIGLFNLRRRLATEHEEDWPRLVSNHLDALESAPVTASKTGPEAPVVPRLLHPEATKRPWSRALVPGRLRLALAEDHPHSVRFLTPQDFVNWGRSVHALEAEARLELKRRTRGMVLRPTGLGGIVELGAPDGLAAARILLADQLIAAPAGVLAAVPGRDGLYLAPLVAPPSAAQIAAMGRLARHLYDRVPYRLSPHVFHVVEGEVRGT